MLFRFRERSSQTDTVKPFLDHLEDLRWMLVKIAIALAITMSASFAFRTQLMEFVQRPLHNLENGKQMVTLMATGVADSMTITFTLAFYAGFILAFPLILYFIAEFILPALHKKERRIVWPALAASFFLFLTGVVFCFYFVLPTTLNFFARDAQHLGLKPSWTIDQYFSFVTNFTLAFGLSFELPVVVYVLLKIDLISYELLRRTRRFAIVGILLLAMFIAPPDLLTMLALALPILVLYEGCIWMAWWLDRKSKSDI